MVSLNNSSQGGLLKPHIQLTQAFHYPQGSIPLSGTLGCPTEQTVTGAKMREERKNRLRKREKIQLHDTVQQNTSFFSQTKSSYKHVLSLRSPESAWNVPHSSHSPWMQVVPERVWAWQGGSAAPGPLLKSWQVQAVCWPSTDDQQKSSLDGYVGEASACLLPLVSLGNHLISQH